MICRKCNFILQGSEKFCPNCGAATPENQQTEKTQEDTPVAPPAILFSSAKTAEANPSQSAIFRDTPPEEEPPESYMRKKSRAPLFLAGLFFIIVIFAGGFLFMEYFDLAPVIAGYLETGTTKSQEETTSTPTTEPAISDYSDKMGVVSPDINFTPTICYVATSGSLPLRKGPDDSYAMISSLTVGCGLQVIGGTITNNNWVYVYVPTLDCYGWLNSSFLSEANLSEESTTESEETTETEIPEEVSLNADSFTATVISSTGLKLREGPGIDYEVILTVPQDETVVVMGRFSAQSTWLYVSYDGYIGYMDGTYLEKL